MALPKNLAKPIVDAYVAVGKFFTAKPKPEQQGLKVGDVLPNGHVITEENLKLDETKQKEFLHVNADSEEMRVDGEETKEGKEGWEVVG